MAASVRPEAAQIMTTDFSQKRRSGGARGCIAHVGARQDREKNGGSPYWGQFGQYAHHDGKEEAHEDLASAAAFVADAMIEADAPFNAREHVVASDCLASLRVRLGTPLLRWRWLCTARRKPPEPGGAGRLPS